MLTLAQLTVLITTKATLISAISSMAGILYVSTLVFKKKFTFFFAMIFNVTMLFIGVQNGIYSEIIQQPMFFLINLIGFINMISRSKHPRIERFLNRLKMINHRLVFATSLLVMIFWSILSYTFGSPIWLKDGVLGGISISAQVFSISENKNSWFGWMALNALNVWTWYTLDNPVMATLYFFYFINSVVGYISWSKE